MNLPVIPIDFTDPMAVGLAIVILAVSFVGATVALGMAVILVLDWLTVLIGGTAGGKGW